MSVSSKLEPPTRACWSPLAAPLVAVAVVAAIAVLGSTAGHAATASRVANGRIFFYRLLVNGGGDIFAVKPSGSDMVRIARSGAEPSVSPDGHMVAFEGQVGCRRTACQGRDVAVMDSNGSHRRTIPGTLDMPNAEYPSFAPDGRQIVFDDGARSIWVTAPDGSNVRRLASVPHGVTVGQPRFSLDGTTIYFNEYNQRTGDGLGTFQMKPDGSDVRRAPKYAGNPLSPNGSTIVFSCGHGLCLVDSNGSHRRRLTSPPPPVPRNTAPVIDGAPQFSPDGTKVVFARYAGNLGPGRWNGPHGLYVVNVNGRHLRKLDGNGNDDGPSWQPLAKAASGAALRR